ncbi:MAG: hypothetical protein KDA92_22935, partial [Planctomycetales bacterium]|nr:hypothetical protein [Planctomycetales bacterium]
ATLYELLTLQRPTAVLGPASTNTGLSPHSLRTFDRRLPADLETIILKGLSDDPADRYHSAGAFADDLQRFVAGRTIQARRPSLTDRTLKWIGRHRAITLSAAASLALMCCVLLASTALVWRANQQSAQALLQSEEHARHIQELLYMADMQVAYQTWDDEQLGQTREILERYLPKPGEPDLRGFEWYALRSIAQEIEPIVFGKHEGAVNQLAVFPDGRRVASVGDDQKLRIWDLASRELLGVADAADSSVEPLFSVAVSPDGKTIATGSDCVLLWDAETLERRQSLASYEYNVQSIAFSPDGNRIAVATRYDLVQLYTITGELINEYMGAARHESLEFTPDGQRILVPSRRDNELDGTKTGFIRAWNADLSQVEFDLCPANHIATNFTQTAISRDGRFFALAEQSAVNPICIVDAESHDVVLRISEEQDQVATLSLSHDGRRLAIGYVNGVIAVPEIDDLSNGTTKTNRKRLFQAHQGALTAVRFIDDRRFLSSGTDGRLKYWELPRQEMSVSMSNAFVGDISISPDDQTLAYIDDDGIQLRSVEGKHLASVPCKTAHRICFSRDSAVVACCVTNSNSVYLLSAATGQQLLHISLATTPRDICLSPTEDRLAIINGIGNVIVWNTRTGEQVNDTLSLYDEREYRDYRCLYSPDGRTLICNGMDEMVSVDIATMTPIRRDPMLIRQFASCFSPDGTWFAVALSNGTIELWKWPSFEHFGSLHGHEGEVRDIAFTQDDRLVSIGQDGTTRVWSPSQLREIGILARSPYVSECFALTAN